MKETEKLANTLRTRGGCLDAIVQATTLGQVGVETIQETVAIQKGYDSYVEVRIKRRLVPNLIPPRNIQR